MVTPLFHTWKQAAIELLCVLIILACVIGLLLL